MLILKTYWTSFSLLHNYILYISGTKRKLCCCSETWRRPASRPRSPTARNTTFCILITEAGTQLRNSSTTFKTLFCGERRPRGPCWRVILEAVTSQTSRRTCPPHQSRVVCAELSVRCWSRAESQRRRAAYSKSQPGLHNNTTDLWVQASLWSDISRYTSAELKLNFKISLRTQKRRKIRKPTLRQK